MSPFSLSTYDTYEDGHCLHIVFLTARLIAFLFALVFTVVESRSTSSDSDQKLFSKSLKSATLKLTGSRGWNPKQQPQSDGGVLDDSLQLSE